MYFDDKNCIVAVIIDLIHSILYKTYHIKLCIASNVKTLFE